MGVYYSATLAYGYVLPELDRNGDPILHPEELAFYSVNKLGYATIGDGYSGAQQHIVGPREFLHTVDVQSGPFKNFDIGTPDTHKVKGALAEFFLVNELERPEGDPRWHFGGHVY